MKFSMAVSFLIAFSLGKGGPKGRMRGACRSDPFAGGSGKAAHQSAGKP